THRRGECFPAGNRRSQGATKGIAGRRGIHHWSSKTRNIRCTRSAGQEPAFRNVDLVTWLNSDSVSRVGSRLKLPTVVHPEQLRTQGKPQPSPAVQTLTVVPLDEYTTQ